MSSTVANLSIDMERYHHLPRPLRTRFDAWMREQCLHDKHIKSLELVDDTTVRAVCRNGINEVTHNFTVTAPPPEGALA